MQILNIEPTVFFIRDGTGLRQQVRITVSNAADAGSRDFRGPFRWCR